MGVELGLPAPLLLASLLQSEDPRYVDPLPYQLMIFFFQYVLGQSDLYPPGNEVRAIELGFFTHCSFVLLGSWPGVGSTSRMAWGTSAQKEKAPTTRDMVSIRSRELL